MTTNLTPSKIYIGSAYYPEHWPEENWKEDIRLMREAGFNVARLAEFAWSTLEPEAGVFNFDWLDRAIAALAEAGISSVLGTPTAVPPAWLAEQHPSVMAVNETGRRVQFGNRCHYCVNSPELHNATRRLVKAMAKHFGPNPHIIGWQIDNEFNRYCFCDHCQQLFQEYLAHRYGSVDNLNARWSTAYWSQTYASWKQIPIPIGPHNPGLMLEFKRFITESYRRFQRLQIDDLRPKLLPGVWITHNFMDWHEGHDHYTITEDLDMASWDWYVGTGNYDYRTTGAAHDLVRGYKRRNFWLMETQPGTVNWKPVNTMLDKGEGYSMAWHAVAHGADAVLYWQWRSAPGGQEQYHGSLIDPSGQPRPFYAEARQVSQDLSAVSSLIAGSRPVAEVALLNCYNSRWSIQWQPHHKEFDYVAHLQHYYRPFAEQNIAVDILSADAPLDGYRLVVAPALIIINDQRVAHMKTFVENGGHLVLTVRTGMKDDYNALLLTRQPGPLAELAGIEVEEFYALLNSVPVLDNAWIGTAQIWAERLKVRDGADTLVLARYGASNGWLDGQPAITECSHGKGRVTYIGAYLDVMAQKLLLNQIAWGAGVRPILETPSGVEACKRVNAAGKEIFIVINHTQAEQRVQLPWPAQEHLRGQALGNEFQLAPYEVAVITQSSERKSPRGK